MRADYKTRFKSVDNAADLAKQVTAVRLPKDIDAMIRSLPATERSAWLRKIISEAVKRELMEKAINSQACNS